MQNNASQGKRKLSVLDEDGDVMMGEDMELGNGGRGKKRRKQRRRQPNGKEIAMQDVEVYHLILGNLCFKECCSSQKCEHSSLL